MKNWKIWGAGLALLIGTPIACSLVGTTAAVTTAPGRVVQRTLTTDNILNNYEAFFDRKAAYEARLGQIRAHTDLVKATTDASELMRLGIERNAMRQSCRELATQYNADAKKANRGLFRSGELPSTLSETACETA